ncbi:MAG: DUF1963 domain-containing protein [Lachnospiraceae bacterium]|nr:DUF1963 domain-containing protein [Lachnospiraceae bacterium]
MNLTGKELAAAIYKRLKETTSKPTVVFELEEGAAGILHSKIGGAFFVPEGMEAPKNTETGEALYLLAQINFEELPPMEDIPKQGLLQIFIDGKDDLYGCDFDNEANQKGWRIRFIENLPSAEEIRPEQIQETEWTEETSLPLESPTVYQLTGRREDQPVSINDYRFDEMLTKYCSDLIPEGVEGFFDLDDDEEMYEIFEEHDCQFGGYPTFTQTDPREYMDNEADVPEILLFQLDTTEGIMWGDSGVGNFFIKKEDLIKKDFSKVWYNWDCC